MGILYRQVNYVPQRDYDQLGSSRLLDIGDAAPDFSRGSAGTAIGCPKKGG
jgi:hypothetical protein